MKNDFSNLKKRVEKLKEDFQAEIELLKQHKTMFIIDNYVIDADGNESQLCFTVDPYEYYTMGEDDTHNILTYPFDVIDKQTGKIYTTTSYGKREEKTTTNI